MLVITKTGVKLFLKQTPFELEYRALNELLLQVACSKPQTEAHLQAVWDDLLMSKVLPRIDGDEDKLRNIKEDSNNNLLERLSELLEQQLSEIWNTTRMDFYREKIDGSAIDDIRSKISEKTRPVFGAYALYPGFYNQTDEENPYQQAIDEIGIGAFSFLPAVDHSGSYWLKLFLQQKLGAAQENYSSVETDKYFVEESIRIPYRGTSVFHYSDLTIAVAGKVPGRSKKYRENLEKGQVNYYHMQLFASERKNIEQNIIKEARYLAIAVTNPLLEHQQEINYIYPIIDVEQKRRAELTKEQTGTDKIRGPDKMYWLFTLGAALGLKSPIIKASARRFEVKLTSAKALSEVNNWPDLPQRYRILN